MRLKAAPSIKRAGDERPDGDDENEGDGGDGGPEKGDDAGGDVDHAFKEEQAPALAVARGLDAGNDGEGAIDQHIGGEQKHERQDRGGGHEQADQAEDDAEHAAQAHRPPTLGQNRAQRVGARCVVGEFVE